MCFCVVDACVFDGNVFLCDGCLYLMETCFCVIDACVFDGNVMDACVFDGNMFVYDGCLCV